MRKFTSIENISTDDFITILDEWNNGKLSTGDVLCWAEAVEKLCPKNWRSYPNIDPRSILFGTLDALVTLHIQPILEEDIPMMKKFLVDGQTDPINAWKMIDHYWDSIDWEQRLKDMYGHNMIV